MKNLGKFKNQFGITLLETVIAATLALIVGTFLVSILASHTGIFYKQSSLVSEGLSLNDALQKISSNIRQASAVASGYPEASPTYITGTQTLVLKLPALSSTGVIASVYDYLVVFPDSSNPKILHFKIFPDPQSSRQAEDLVLTTLLQSLTFSYYDKLGNVVAPTAAVSVNVNLAVLSQTGQIGTSQSSNITTTLRNISP